MNYFVILLVSCLAVSVVSFQPVTLPPKTKTTTTTPLFAENNNNGMDRRDMLFGLLVAIEASAALVSLPTRANAKPASTFFFDETIELVKEPAQMPTDGKLDLNAAFVGDYKNLRGMFPHAAGKIASNGPYKRVKDIYKIPGLTENDKKLFRKYEGEMTVNPPGRAFDERINARVST